jgi:hypothetical protein
MSTLKTVPTTSPSLGSNSLGSYQAGTTDDRERDDSDDEDGGDDEPMMGACERHPTSRESPWGRSGELTVSRYGSNSQERWGDSRATLPSHDECEAERIGIKSPTSVNS